MTKSAKRKKEKTADFTKRKLKLGKGKQLATNSVDTSFKARSIALPQQSIATANDTSGPTTKRKLTLDALLTHLKHYGSGVRKDSLQGLQELLSEYPALIGANLSRLVNSCVRLISDEDASVRRALHSFLSWLLPQIPKDHLVPHASALLLFTASAQSHIFQEIRLDAIRLLDLLLELIPEQVVAGFWGGDPSGNRASHGRKLLDGYLGLLNVGARFSNDEGKDTGPSTRAAGQSISLITLSSAAKTSVLKSFATFLHHAIAQGDDEPKDSIPLWYLSGAFSSQEAFASFANLLSVQRVVRRPRNQIRFWSEIDQDDFSGLYSRSNVNDGLPMGEVGLDVESILAEIDRLGHDDRTSDGLGALNGRLLTTLCRTLHPVLVSMFLDCAPSVFSPTQASPEAELELVLALMTISRCMYGCLLRDPGVSLDQKEIISRDLEALVVHISAYFPFGETWVFAPDITSESVFNQMNLIYCDLFSLRCLDYVSGTSGEEQGPVTKRRKLNHMHSGKAIPKTMPDTSVARQVERVREFVTRCLRGATSGASAVTHPLGQSLTAQSYMELLPTLWWLLDREDSDDVSEVLKAVLHHATKAGSTSNVKPVATEFVCRLILLQSEPSYSGSFRIGVSVSDDLQKALRDWSYNLPKVLWELGDKNPTTTELILLFILRLIQRRSWLNLLETCISLCARFAPFFTVQHAIRGDVHGPFSRLDKSPTASLEISLEPSEPSNIGKLEKVGPLKKLALDVAAVLVSTSPGDSPVRSSRSAPRKINSLSVQRSVCDRHPSGSGNDPVSVMGSSSSTLVVLQDARATLRNAVNKAVSGTTEEAYWLGVSRI